MRGSPLFRAALVLCALLALLWPLRSLTSNRAGPAHAAAPPEKAKSIHLVITSTTFPFRFEIAHLGQVIWKGESAENSIARDITMQFPSGGIELLVNASWSEKKETALRVEVAVDDDQPMTGTLWGTDHVSDVLTFTQSP